MNWIGRITGYIDERFDFELHQATGRYAYAWRGGPIARAHAGMLGYPAQRPTRGARITVGTFPLIVLDECVAISGVVAVRTDVPFWHLAVARYRLSIIGSRLLATCQIWNLARYDFAAEPTWRDVYLLDWIAKRVRGD